MISKPGKLNLLLKELYWLKIEDLNQRKILQKTIYILMEMGLNYRYSYNWYFHGPYCSELAEDAYEVECNQEYYNEETDSYRYKKDTQKIIDCYKNIFKDHKKNSDWLELISSLLFLRRYNKLDNSNLKKRLLEKKKFKENHELVDKAMTFIEKNFPPNLESSPIV